MKTFKNVGAQGDVRLVRIADGEKIPSSFTRRDPDAKGELILAHSESGHHHVMDGDVVEQYSDAANSFIQYIVVKANAEMRHNKTGADAHETIGVPAGTFKVIRQREATPEGFRRVED